MKPMRTAPGSRDSNGLMTNVPSASMARRPCAIRVEPLRVGRRAKPRSLWHGHRAVGHGQEVADDELAIRVRPAIELEESRAARGRQAMQRREQRDAAREEVRTIALAG